MTTSSMARWTTRAARVFAAALLGVAVQPGVPRAARAAARPDWVEHAGASTRYPAPRFLTGYGSAGRGEGAGGAEDALESAKARAAADLASKISVRIQHELRDVSEERDGRARYEVAAVTRSTADVRVSGLRYETWRRGDTVHALAVLERGPAAARRRDARQRALAELRTCVDAGARHASEGRVADAARTYESCRRPLAEALEHDAVVRVLAPQPRSEAAFDEEVLRLARRVEEGSQVARRGRAGSLAEAADALALQLHRQGLDGATRLTVAPFTYGTTGVASAFGREAALELERALARRTGVAAEAPGGPAAGPAPFLPPGAAAALQGVYLERDDAIRLVATVRDTRSGRLAASAEAALPRASLPDPAALRPANFEAALRDQRILAEGELLSGDLRVELWTQKGAQGVVLGEGERLHLYARVNRPAWLRLVYVLENGMQVPVDQGWYLDASKVNRVVEYPDSFEVVAPFGVEHVHATAFPRRPDPLPTVRRTVAGVEYEVVADGLDAVVRHRGLARDARRQIGEALVSVTTVAAAPID